MTRKEWLDGLCPGNQVLFSRAGKEPRALTIRSINDGLVLLMQSPNDDPALGEAVWSDMGEGPFGERIDPIPEILSSIGGDPDASDQAVGGWEAA